MDFFVENTGGGGLSPDRMGPIKVNTEKNHSAYYPCNIYTYIYTRTGVSLGPAEVTNRLYTAVNLYVYIMCVRLIATDGLPAMHCARSGRKNSQLMPPAGLQ